MLLQLQINNIALIDKINIELGEGLNILTGETGAGKSIIIDSINAILGERVSKDIIRTGTEKASVEAVFQIDNERLSDFFQSIGIEPEEDGTLIVSRDFTLSGKNTCRINGKMSTVSMLKELGKHLIDIHGQFDNQSLLRTESHIDLLDSFAGEALNTIKTDYLNCLEEYKSVKSKLHELTGDKNDRERRIELLKYQIDEISRAKLKPGEEEKLNKKRLVLSNSEKIIGALTNAYEFLYSGDSIKKAAQDALNEALCELNSIVKIEEKYGNLASRIEEVSYILDDIISEIRNERESIEYSPELLGQIEERIDLIYKLKRKYGTTVEEIIENCGAMEDELNGIMQGEELVTELKDKLLKIESNLYMFAKRLDEERLSACEVLESRIGAELDDLEMKKAKFKVSIEFDDLADADGQRKYFANGLNKVEFLISANAGEPLKPLSKIASGGEMSRIMLAIKTILANVDHMPTLIFDEIDIGISGKAAQSVGEKLSIISENHQVICVTHLAQIACMAKHHYLIEKISKNDSTTTTVNRLKTEEIKYEVARILGGTNITDITLKHAEEMIQSARAKIGPR